MCIRDRSLFDKFSITPPEKSVTLILALKASLASKDTVTEDLLLSNGLGRTVQLSKLLTSDTLEAKSVLNVFSVEKGAQKLTPLIGLTRHRYAPPTSTGTAVLVVVTEALYAILLPLVPVYNLSLIHISEPTRPY